LSVFKAFSERIQSVFTAYSVRIH